jgi:hypothetical protein
MTLRDDPYAASSGYAASLPLEESTSGPQQRLASPTGIGRLVADAMQSSEFSESAVGGMPIRRQGQGLHLSYGDALELLGFSGGAAE